MRKKLIQPVIMWVIRLFKEWSLVMKDGDARRLWDSSKYVVNILLSKKNFILEEKNNEIIIKIDLREVDCKISPYPDLREKDKFILASTSNKKIQVFDIIKIDISSGEVLILYHIDLSRPSLALQGSLGNIYSFKPISHTIQQYIRSIESVLCLYRK